MFQDSAKLSNYFNPAKYHGANLGQCNSLREKKCKTFTLFCSDNTPERNFALLIYTRIKEFTNNVLKLFAELKINRHF